MPDKNIPESRQALYEKMKKRREYIKQKNLPRFSFPLEGLTREDRENKEDKESE